MTLQEFVEQNNGIRHVFDDMEHRIKTKDKVVGRDEWRKNLDTIYNDYYIIDGYLRAAYDYGHISFEERYAIEDELELVLVGKEG